MPLGRRTFLKGLASLFALPIAAKAVAASSQPREAVLDIEGPNGPVGLCDIEISRLIIDHSRRVSGMVMPGLITSIKNVGVHVPIVVTPSKKYRGCYDVQDGLHRVMACEVVGVKTIPCLVLLEWQHDWDMLPNRMASRSFPSRRYV